MTPEPAPPPGPKQPAVTYPWWIVLFLVGLDYFSTLAYLPSIAVAQVGPLAPLAAVGPNLRQLARECAAAFHLDTSIALDVAGGRVLLSLASLRYSSSAQPAFTATHTHTDAGGTTGNSVEAPSLEQGMLNLARRWPKGTLQFDTVKVSARDSPLAPAALRELCAGAWAEAFGVVVPGAAELKAHARKKKVGRAQDREEMLKYLRGGAAGVKRWNARTEAQRKAGGHFRGVDLAGGELAKAVIRWRGQASRSQTTICPLVPPTAARIASRSNAAAIGRFTSQAYRCSLVPAASHSVTSPSAFPVRTRRPSAETARADSHVPPTGRVAVAVLLDKSQTATLFASGAVVTAPSAVMLTWQGAFLPRANFQFPSREPCARASAGKPADRTAAENKSREMRELVM